MEDEQSSQATNPGNSPDVDTLTSQIMGLVRSGSFDEAERLREQLMETNPMAIGSIVSTAEAIEAEKTKRLDPDHLSSWSELYDSLDEEETNCLFYSLKQAQLESGKLLLSQGRSNERLFFIESGTVALFYRKKGKNIRATNLGAGDIIGEDSFFGISLCPFYAATQSEVKLRYLPRRIADSWWVNQSGLYGKLAEFCRVHGIGEKTAEQKSSGRREHRRYPASASAAAFIIDSQGNRTETYFKGDLSDLSRSGTCFSIRCSKQEIARGLLSRAVDIVIVFDDLPDKKIGVRGTIVKLSYHLHNDYSVHVRFSEVISTDLFKTFPCDWSAEEKR